MFKFIEAVLILSGMIIGVGMFGIPFSFAKAGFWLGSVELVLLTGLVLLMHWLYKEIILHTPSFHRFPGYIKIHLGVTAEAVATASAIFSVAGAMVAYLILGGGFLQTIFNTTGFISINNFGAVFLIVLVGAVTSLFPLKKEAFVNGVLTALLIGFVIVLIVILFPHTTKENFGEIDFSYAFVPYGILIFALSGGVVIPEVVTVLNRDRKKVRLAIILGTLIPALLYFFFAYAMVGVFGTKITSDAVSSLGAILGNQALILGSSIGFLAVFTSYIILVENFNATMRLDFKTPRPIAWFVSAFASFFFFLLGFKDFIILIGAIGAIAGGIEAALLVGAYHKMRIREGHHVSIFSYAWKFSMVALVSAGIVVELYSVL